MSAIGVDDRPGSPPFTWVFELAVLSLSTRRRRLPAVKPVFGLLEFSINTTEAYLRCEPKCSGSAWMYGTYLLPEHDSVNYFEVTWPFTARILESRVHTHSKRDDIWIVLGTSYESGLHDQETASAWNSKRPSPNQFMAEAMPLKAPLASVKEALKRAMGRSGARLLCNYRDHLFLEGTAEERLTFNLEDHWACDKQEITIPAGGVTTVMAFNHPPAKGLPQRAALSLGAVGGNSP